ncbi:MAG: Glu-tRNA(Gln) amidotransferase subunit GatE, partial [Bacteroidales bacterium]
MEDPDNPKQENRFAVQNYRKTREAIGYTPRKQASLADYQRIGFKSGLEVHQQLKTARKLFCRCPAGIYHDDEHFDAEVIRHMRPTLSEMGGYDGTALMEYKTRKEIIYRLNNQTACTYEIDDTPPFPIDREALEYALEISLLCKLNVVGEVHITRKQYLDGSIPTGFQRTAILGVEGEIPLKNKTVRLIQLSIEEDSCREVSDIRHTRVYKTDRLGMPLIETVTYPDMETPDELKEAAEYIRFLNRSTNKVRTGIGAGREDVNVSCQGGTRVEIKGVAHNKWIPELSHNEAFRQWALLHIRELLQQRFASSEEWQMQHSYIKEEQIADLPYIISSRLKEGYKLIGINLPGFRGILSHFTQPGNTFTHELIGRLKVIACLELPNMASSEDLEPLIADKTFETLKKRLQAGPDDAQLLLWTPQEDEKTALETIDERCKMAFEGVPEETRKSFPDGTTVFERVLPGADRMYPDTDSAPIALSNEYIESLREGIPSEVAERYKALKKWNAPEDTYTYIFRNNWFPIIHEAAMKLSVPAKYTATLLGHRLKNLEGKITPTDTFPKVRIYELLKFLRENDLQLRLAEKMLPMVYQYPKMDFPSILENLEFKRMSVHELKARIPFLKEKFTPHKPIRKKEKQANWLMGELRSSVLGNIAP